MMRTSLNADPGTAGATTGQGPGSVEWAAEFRAIQTQLQDVQHSLLTLRQTVHTLCEMVHDMSIHIHPTSDPASGR